MASFLNLLPLTGGEIREREQAAETFSAACYTKEKEVRKKPTITRRQFLLAGGTATAWAVLGRPVGVAAAAGRGVDAYTLRVGYSEREIGRFRLRTRSYNSSLPGPLMVTRPGHTLRVKLINALPADSPAAAPPGIETLNNPHAFNTTNLHVHGLQLIHISSSRWGQSIPPRR